ncbi:MAG TPA: redoxin domain-containing protein [Candidatus Kapabacteria bacterium]|nr:redoxin domain-containing protein [Candidatus Kapabacteria bacterium]
MKVNYVLLFLLILSYNLYSQNENEDYFSSNKIGDNIKIYGSPSKLNALVFIDDNSCFTCYVSLNALYNEYKAIDPNVNFICFVTKSTEQIINSFKNKYNWKFTIVADPLGAYVQFYKIKHLPTYIATDINGRILFIDKCMGPDLKLDFINKEVNKTQTEQITNDRIIKEFEITYKDNKYPSNFMTKINYYPEDSIFICLNDYENSIDFISNKGLVYKRFMLDDFENLTVINPISFERIKGDNKIMYIDIDYRTRPILYILNLKNNKIEKSITFKRNFDTLNYFIDQTLYYNEKSNNIIANIIPLNRESKTEYKNLLVYDMEGNLKKQFGFIDSIYQKWSKFSIYNVKVLISDDYIYTIQESSDRINIFNKDFKFSHSILINHDTIFKKGLKDISADLNQDEWVLINSNNSYYDKLFLNNDNNNIYITFYNTYYKELTSNPLDLSNIYFRFFTYIIDSNDNSKQTLLEQPQNSKPVYFAKDYYILLEYDKNYSVIKYYKY